MKLVSSGFLALLLVTVLIGCASTNPLPVLEKGKTNQAEVRSSFGEPNKKEITAEGEVWHYSFVKDDKARSEGFVTMLNLVVSFTDKVVDDYKINITQEKVAQDKDMKKDGPRDMDRQRRSFPKRRPPRMFP